MNRDNSLLTPVKMKTIKQMQEELIKLGDKMHELSSPEDQLQAWREKNPDKVGTHHPLCIHYGGWARVMATVTKRKVLKECLEMANDFLNKYDESNLN